MFRATFHYSGHVQGVGFRYAAHGIASRYAVTGYIRNLRDGRVEVVAEGSEEDIKAFAGAVRESMAGYIRSVEESWSESQGKFSRFEVRF